MTTLKVQQHSSKSQRKAKTELITIVQIVRKKSGLWTTSLDVAEKFGKRHDHVLRDIEKLDCSPGFRSPNFGEIFYQDKHGRTQKAYEMTRGGFSFLAMGFTGKRAAHWKEQYIAAFDAMEQYILNQACQAERRARLDWLETRAFGKEARKTETDTIQRFVEYATTQGSSKPKWYYKHITNTTYKALGFIEKSLPKEPIRELLDRIGLSKLSTAEFMVSEELEQGMNAGLFYKDIFQDCKAKLERYADVVGRHPKILAADSYKRLETKVATEPEAITA